jgi:hypothetical protein
VRTLAVAQRLSGADTGFGMHRGLLGLLAGFVAVAVGVLALGGPGSPVPASGSRATAFASNQAPARLGGQAPARLGGAMTRLISGLRGLPARGRSGFALTVPPTSVPAPPYQPSVSGVACPVAGGSCSAVPCSEFIGPGSGAVASASSVSPVGVVSGAVALAPAPARPLLPQGLTVPKCNRRPPITSRVLPVLGS